MAVVRFGHLGICVSDLSRSIAFYRDILGFRMLTYTDVSGADADQLLQLENIDQRTVFLERDGVRLALFAFSSPEPVPQERRPMNQVGFAAIMLRVDDLEQTLATCREAGITIREATRTDYPAYHSRLVFIDDPDGTAVELVEIPGDPYRPFGEPYCPD